MLQRLRPVKEQTGDGQMPQDDARGHEDDASVSSPAVAKTVPATATATADLKRQDMTFPPSARQWRDHLTSGVALLVAVILHGSLFYALMAFPEMERFVGDGGNRRDAIAVTLITSQVLDTQGERDSAGRSAPAPVQAGQLLQGGANSQNASASSALSSSGGGKTGDPIEREKSALDVDNAASDKVAKTNNGARKAAIDDQLIKSQQDNVREKPVEDAKPMDRPERPGAASSKFAASAKPAASAALEISSDHSATTDKGSEPPDDIERLPVLTARLRASLTHAQKAQQSPVKQDIARARYNKLKFQLNGESVGASGRETARTRKLPRRVQTATAGSMHDDRRHYERNSGQSKAGTQNAAIASALATARSGGVQARLLHISDERMVAAAAAANIGEKNKFARLIGKTLIKGIPPVRHRRGLNAKLVVLFALNRDGALRYVRIRRSSGRKRLDRAIVSALKSIDFPTPPADMTPRELIYTLPFYFN